MKKKLFLFLVSLLAAVTAMAQGQKISASELIPGDLIFWANSSGRLYHVGIYTGPNRFVHNTNSSRGWVKEDNISDMGKDPAGYARY